MGIALLLLGSGCGSDTELDRNLGGAASRDDASQNSFGLPVLGMTNEQRRRFEVGDSFFTQNWVTAPASTDARDGLGPLFNAQACSSCHVRDGRGLPPDPHGETGRLGLLLRLSVPGADALTGGPLPEPTYGNQLQDRAVLDVVAEGTVAVTYDTTAGTYGDGQPYELQAPTYGIANLAFGELDEEVLIGPRLAPQVIGMGLLEAISAESILASADPEDRDDDGISGRANLVWDGATQSLVLGRFGWKANVATVEQQVAGAFHGDIGITSTLHPEENCGSQSGCADLPNGSDPLTGEPEIPDERLGSVVFYNRTLAVPVMRNTDQPEVRRGAELFETFGCAQCHTSTQQTGSAILPTLTDQTIHTFTDLLLHDMGPGLADGRPDFLAGGSEWRTPPLWGLGLIDDINGERFLLHDGRARSIAEAILWHGGEGERSRELFRTASPEERSALLAFLEAL